MDSSAVIWVLGVAAVGFLSGLLALIAYIARLRDWEETQDIDLSEFGWLTREVGGTFAALCMLPLLLLMPLAKYTGVDKVVSLYVAIALAFLFVIIGYRIFVRRYRRDPKKTGQKLRAKI